MLKMTGTANLFILKLSFMSISNMNFIGNGLNWRNMRTAKGFRLLVIFRFMLHMTVPMSGRTLSYSRWMRRGTLRRLHHQITSLPPYRWHNLLTRMHSRHRSYENPPSGKYYFSHMLCAPREQRMPHQAIGKRALVLNCSMPLNGGWVIYR